MKTTAIEQTKRGASRIGVGALLSAIVLSFGTAPTASAFTTDAAKKTMVSDGSFGDTAAAIAAAKGKNEDGWVLTVGEPGGTYTWPNQMVINLGRDFTIQGASSTVPTTIKSTFNGPIGIWVDAGVNKVFTMKNFHLTGWSSSGRLMEIVGTGECFRLTNLTVTQSYESTNWLWIADPSEVGKGDGPFGLIDHCTFNGYPAPFIRQNRSSSDANWPNNHKITWGTRKAVFIEDCTYNGSPTGAPSAATDGNQAGKLVVRHCTLNNASVEWHGRDSGGVPNVDFRFGFLSGEVYNNTFNATRGMGAPLVMIRSGTALVWNNTVNVSGVGTVTVGAQLQTHNTSNWHLDDVTGAPRPPLVYPVDHPDGQQAGLPEPVRVWGNKNGHLIRFGWAIGDSAFTQQNREYIGSDDDSARPAGYVPFTYPHPLQNAGNSETQRPSPPANVRVTPSN